MFSWPRKNDTVALRAGCKAPYGRQEGLSPQCCKTIVNEILNKAFHVHIYLFLGELGCCCKEVTFLLNYLLKE